MLVYVDAVVVDRWAVVALKIPPLATLFLPESYRDFLPGIQVRVPAKEEEAREVRAIGLLDEGARRVVVYPAHFLGTFRSWDDVENYLVVPVEVPLDMVEEGAEYYALPLVTRGDKVALYKIE